MLSGAGVEREVFAADATLRRLDVILSAAKDPLSFKRRAEGILRSLRSFRITITHEVPAVMGYWFTLVLAAGAWHSRRRRSWHQMAGSSRRYVEPLVEAGVPAAPKRRLRWPKVIDAIHHSD